MSRPIPITERLSNWLPRLALMPSLLVVLVAVYLFIAWTGWISLSSSKIVPKYDFVGLEQYIRLWSTPRWHTAVANLFIFSTLFLGITTGLGLLMAILLDQQIRAEGVLRAIFLYPMALSFIVTGTAWKWILNPALGVQKVVNDLGWTSFVFDWIAQPTFAIYCVVIAAVWQSTGFAMAIFLAGLRGIDNSVIKAAQIEGAGLPRIYRSIIVPMLRPAFLSVIVLLSYVAIKSFDLILALTNTGPGSATEMPSTFMYSATFRRDQMGVGAASAMMMLMTVAAIIVPYLYSELREAVMATNAASLRRQQFLGRVVIYGALLFMAAFYLMPLWVMIVTSVKHLDEIYAGSFIGLPKEITFEAWQTAWSSACNGTACMGLKPYFINSILMAVPAVILSTGIGAINGYIVTKWRFPGSNLIFGLLLFGCFLPFQAVILPMAQTLGILGLAGTLPGLVLVHTVYGIAFTTLFFRNYFVGIPDELVKAAQIDGAGFVRIFVSIMLPTALPIIVVSCIWQFTQIWNDYLFGASFTAGENAPITVALNNIVNVSMGRKEYNVDMAAAMIAALPTLLVYVVAGRYFVRGLTAGAVKG